MSVSPIYAEHGKGGVFNLGVATMRLLAAAEETGGSFALAEFSGGEGAWTVPHVHRRAAESFYILEGRFDFTIADETVTAAGGEYILVPPGTKHVLGAQAGGGTALVLWVPGGLEQMFIELSQLAPEAIVDPKIRAEIASRHDSIPV